MQSFKPFVPVAGDVKLNRGVSASSIRTVAGFKAGGVVDTAAMSEDGSRLLIWFVGMEEPLACLTQALSADDMISLVESVKSAVTSAAVVYPVVAVNQGNNASSYYFCGLSDDLLVNRTARPASGILNL